MLFSFFASGFFACAIASCETLWFDEAYEVVTATAAGWSDTAGTWTRGSAADSSSATRGFLDLNTHGGRLAFEPNAASAADARTVFEFTASLTAYRDGEGGAAETAETAPKAALSLRQEDGATAPVFLGWVSTRDAAYAKGSWRKLSAAGLVPEENRDYDFRIELANDCVPTRVRYSVRIGDDYVPLADATGETWFSTRCALDPAVKETKRARRMLFSGTGRVGEIRATTAVAAAEEPRATVSFAGLSRPQAGKTELTPAVEPFEGASVDVGTLAWRWHRIDAAGYDDGRILSTAATYVPAADDLGHWIVADAADAAGFVGRAKFWFSDLPVVVIDVADGAWPSSAKEGHKGAMRIVGNAAFKDQYDGALDKINVRGNSTAFQDKKPYKLKLADKADLFGLGGGTKNKHWVLLANCLDESLMRNKLCYDLSGELGLVSMRSEWVDVVMNGEYVGNYLLCQHIRIGDERVPAYDWSKAYEKLAEGAAALGGLSEDEQSDLEAQLEEDMSWLDTGTFEFGGVTYRAKDCWKKFSSDVSGGYVFEIDQKKSKEPSFEWVNRESPNGWLKLAVLVNTPEFAFTSRKMHDFVIDRWGRLADAWISGEGYDADGHHYSELADFDSMVAYWLANYVPCNNDAIGFSRYAWLDVGGKVTFGPAWDFDIGVGSLQARIDQGSGNAQGLVTDGWGEVSYPASRPTVWLHGNSHENFFGHWTADPYFDYRVRERYWAIRPYLEHIVEPGGLIDDYKKKLAVSARANDIRWNNRIGFFGTPTAKGDVEELRDFLKARLAWLDGLLAEVDDGIANLAGKNQWGNSQYVGLQYWKLHTKSVAPSVPSAPTVATEPLEAGAAVPTANAAKVEVRVNGLVRTTVPVESGAAAAELAPSVFRYGEENFVEFVVRDADGAALARNFALVTPSLPETVVSDGDRPSVPTVWLRDAWAQLAATGAKIAIPAPADYADLVALKDLKPSPIGKVQSLAEDYVAGTDPADAEDVFTATIEIGPDGAVSVSWKPRTPELDATRAYRLRGRADLDAGPWAETDARNPDPAFLDQNRFYRVDVSLPTD